ncbi:preprotein translocase subunit SecG [Catenovulum maritimum]|jgi:preprotein translocase subunit SecG|uniref:Protein-export membrane protein SecG n=1 Tax=Catenovulum maritimum TaxID=1513271 RepID=A0A0J8GRX2_9ALTE|nr:preprotein translocase subunit SecG [Catenovulum maritimum]KMT64039.1 preprotein translocase subunit SecG [Catenovulum maritimum]
MFEVLLVVYIIIAVALVGFILIQQGKGADMGASFGSGSSNTMFGSSGAGNFLTKTTTVLATCFFILCLVLGGVVASQNKNTDDFGDLEAPVAVEAASEDVPAVDPDSDIPQ